MRRRLVHCRVWTDRYPANEYNDENIFVTGSTHAEVDGIKVEANPSRQLAVYLKQEIERIISLSKRYDPAT